MPASASKFSRASFTALVFSLYAGFARVRTDSRMSTCSIAEFCESAGFSFDGTSWSAHKKRIEKKIVKDDANHIWRSLVKKIFCAFFCFISCLSFWFLRKVGTFFRAMELHVTLILALLARNLGAEPGPRKKGKCVKFGTYLV